MQAQYTKARNVQPANEVDTVRFVAVHSRDGKTYEQKQPSTYRGLQALCKEWGLKASGSADDLRRRLWRSEHDPCALKDTDVARKARVESEAVAIAKENGLTYRDAQRKVKALRERLGVKTLPRKNVGWENVLHNLEWLTSYETELETTTYSDDELACMFAMC